MAYKQGEEYSKLKYNPLVLNRQEKMWDVYPDFAKRPLLCKVPEEYEERSMEGFESKDLNKLLKFIVLFVDPLSPFAGERDFDIRESLCMDALDYKNNHKFYKEVKEVTDYFIGVMFQYFQMIHAVRYEYWFTTLMSYRQINSDLLTGKIKLQARKAAMEIQAKNIEQIEDMEHRIFPDELTKKLIADKATRGLRGYAEKYAQELTLEEN